ncbi:hydroxymethylbilane synthase [Hydrogenobaculum acidophilum]
MKLRLGTRKSKLALWQSEFVKSKLEGLGLEVELVLITTTGDKILDVPLANIGGKGLFVKEIENALLEKEIDFAVHSLKDVPAIIPEGLVVDVFLEREDPRDAFISKTHKSLKDLPPDKKIGTSSIRRKVQLLQRKKDIIIEDLRGNVDTRLRKLEEGLYDAIILASAGLKRLGMTQVITEHLDFIPAVGQGIIAIEYKASNKEVSNILKKINHEPTYICALAERSFLETVEGSCQIPMGAHATLTKEGIKIRGFIAKEDGQDYRELTLEGKDPIKLGKELAKNLL